MGLEDCGRVQGPGKDPRRKANLALGHVVVADIPVPWLKGQKIFMP